MFLSLRCHNASHSTRRIYPRRGISTDRLRNSVQWRCGNNISRHLHSSSAKKGDGDKPFYVTTPIFYVNAAPHVGHLYSMVLADILKRWNQLKGRKSILCTGTDEHGMKVQRAALKARTEPKAFCDTGADLFKSLADKADLSNDYFIRTTDPDHREAVQYAWTSLIERGHIYLSKHEGWYSVSDETFYPPSAVHLIIEPSSGRKIMASIETGKEVEWTSETNYRFKLSAFKDRLLDFYKANPNFVVPETRMKEVVQSVSEGLEDLSVSRPSSRLTWGIPVPLDEGQTIYVWLDALLNYLTKTGYPSTPGSESSNEWPADCHVIGKDIVRFHCIYWPAFLMALDLPPPRQVLTHAHWTLGKEKMAKSTGNVVNPFFAINRFSSDIMRFYLAHDGGIKDDSDYSNEFIIDRYEKALRGEFGGLASRLLRSKNWNTRHAVQVATTQDGLGIEKIAERDPDALRQLPVHADMLRNLAEQFKERMDNCDIGGAIELVLKTIRATNAMFTQAVPWQVYFKMGAARANTVTESNQVSDSKKSSAHDPEVTVLDSYTLKELSERLAATTYLTAESLRLAGILLKPIMPKKMDMLLDMLGVERDSDYPSKNLENTGARNVKEERQRMPGKMRSFVAAKLGADKDYGVSLIPLGQGHKGALFKPLACDT